MNLVQQLAAEPAISRIAELLERPKGARIVARGSHGSSSAFVAAAIASRTKRPLLYIVAHLDETDETIDELTSFGVQAVRCPALEVLPGESSVSLELFAERLGVVRELLAMSASASDDHTRDTAFVLVTPIAALMQPTPGPSSLDALARTIRLRDRLDPTVLIAWLADAGYERVEAIEEPGEFAVRGGIIDIFPTASLAPGLSSGDTTSNRGASAGHAAVPVRLDFFGDEVDRITEIDLDTMGSDRALDGIELVCASLDHALASASAKAPATTAKGLTQRHAAGRGVPKSRPGPAPGTIDATGGATACSVLDYLPASTITVLHEVLEITEQARGYFERLTDPRIFGPPAVFARLQERFGRAFIEIAQFSGGKLDSDETIELPVQPLPELSRDAGEAVAELAGLQRADSAVSVFCQNAGELSRLSELLTEHAPLARPDITASVAYVHRGFVWELAGNDSKGALNIVPYHELLHRFETRRRVGSRDPGRMRGARAMDTFLDFGAGDYVVHRDHGIAIFRGLMVMQPREVKRDGPVVLPSERPKKGKGSTRAAEAEDPDEGLEEYLLLEFSGASKLYVPASKIDQVQKYVGGFRGAPTLSVIGGTRWKKQKDSVAESVKNLAGELLRVRAARQSIPGVRFPGDTTWQREFEAEFPFTETDDQLAAIVEIKKDMQSERPMDRLLCGDVGYGKTEVAMRGAFKAVEFGKQVAVLVPTTVLCEQHERTFRSRMADYPFKVASISRFKTTKEISDTLADVRAGRIDVIIGTHRLLSKDVHFSDLGLVVIDEEQRFGVEHKERLLALRLTVDVLTLSATPIPRTLHMSMLGLRDISSLTQAPMDRRAVVTEVIPYNAKRIQQAIARELARDGQVFFVHNRVHDIRTMADEIQKLAPDARIVVGHGQMPDDELEKVMMTFMQRRADILVSTTIIESGIDIPTANTMFINNADRFGLAELHQLRGRVGRYKHRAYCYMLLPEDRVIGEKGVKRLKAIEEFNMLGAGFKIAMRDLEIRGAGNILGPEQSGHIAAVGYEMYCQLLDQAVKTLTHEPTQIVSETSIEIGLTGMIPKRYISSDARRMDAYRRIAVARTSEELNKLETELAQAYGLPLPAATRRLLDLAALRVAASMLHIRSVAVRGSDVLLRLKQADTPPVAARLQPQMPMRPDTQPGSGARSGPSLPAQAAGATDPLARAMAMARQTKPSSAPPLPASPLPASAPPAIQMTILPPKKGEELAEIYFRPPPNYMDPATLLRVLVARLSVA